MAPKTDRRHLRGEESRTRILDATIEIAAERGYEGTSISLVRDRSGLPASSIYWHFRSKDELFAAVIQRSFDDWDASVRQIAMDSSGFADSMRRQAAALLASPEFLRLGLMLSLERRPEEATAKALFLQVRAESKAGLARMFLAALTDAGRPDVVAADRLARLSMAAVDGLFVAVQVDQTAEQFLDTLDLLIDIIGARIAQEVQEVMVRHD